jgi:hypothetical protein
MYDAFGSKIYNLSDAIMLEELEKFAVKEIIAKSVNYSTKISEEDPVKLPPAQRSTAHSSPALSKSKKIAVKQPPAHSSPAFSKSKKIAAPAHSSPAHSSPSRSSPTKQPPAKFKPPANAQALDTLGLQRENQHILAVNTSSVRADSTSTVIDSTPLWQTAPPPRR